MRAIWSGVIGFALVNIPVKLYSATKSEGLNFDLLHAKDHSPIRYARFCKLEEKEVPYEEIVKGYQLEKGQYVLLTDEDFKKADMAGSNTIEIMEFANRKEIEPIYYEKPYYLVPDKGAAKAFSILKEALMQNNKVGVVKFVLRNRDHLALVEPLGNALILYQLRFAEELRSTHDLDLPLPAEEVRVDELDIASTLIDRMTQKFDPEEFKDTYSQKLKSLIEAKAKGQPIKVAETPQATNVDDIMKALKESLEREKQKV